jgi:hypothetical protein
MKLFTKSIDKKLFAQYPKGGNLEGQKVIAKVFNPYGRGRWYIMNSDPEDPDYLWGIVELFEGEPEVGSISRTELENIKVGAFKLPLERDLYFNEVNAMELYRGLKNGKRYEKGGKTDNVRTIGFDDAVLYRDEIYYLVKRKDEVGLVSYEQGAWGSKGKFIPLKSLSVYDVEENITDPRGNKVNIPPYEELMQRPYGFMEDGGRLEDAGYLVQMAEDYAEREYEKPVKKGEGIAKATRTEDGKLKYTEVIVLFKDGESKLFEEEDFEEFFDIDEYAKGGTIKLLDQYDIDKGNYFYRRYEGAVGSFAWRNDDNKYNEGILFPLNDFDKDFYSHIQLKDGEGLFRYKTEIMGDNLFPLIKVNFDKLVVHFLDDSTDEKNPKFYRRGTPLIYITLERYYYEVREFAKGGKLSYTPKYKITNATIKYEGKEYLVSGDDLITGAYKLAEGGLSDKYVYIPKRDVIKITTKDGDSLTSNVNGVWVKKEYFASAESKSSGKYEPSQATKVFAYKLTELAKDKEMTLSFKDSMVESLSMVDDFVSDLKYEIENNISGLAITTYAKAVKFVSKKSKPRVAKNLAFYENSDVIKLFPEEFTKTTILSKKAIPMKGNLLENTAYLNELSKFTSDDALRPAMTSIHFDGKDVVATDAHILVHLRNEVEVEKQSICTTKVCNVSKGADQRYPDWSSIVARNLDDSKYKNHTFDLDKLIVLTNWINNYYSVWENYVRVVSVTTKNGQISFNPEKLLQALTMLKVMGVKKPIMYYESPNRAVYFGEDGKLGGDPLYDNFVLLMPLLGTSVESFSLDVTTNEYKIVVPNFEYAKGGAMGDGKQLTLFAKGGATFDDKVRAIKRNLVGKNVPKDYQGEYGKKYDKDEAEESARLIAGAMRNNYKK